MTARPVPEFLRRTDGTAAERLARIADLMPALRQAVGVQPPHSAGPLHHVLAEITRLAGPPRPVHTPAPDARP